MPFARRRSTMRSRARSDVNAVARFSATFGAAPRSFERLVPDLADGEDGAEKLTALLAARVDDDAAPFTADDGRAPVLCATGRAGVFTAGAASALGGVTMSGLAGVPAGNLSATEAGALAC